MYVCICAAVTDKQIRRAVADGARSLAEVTMALGVGAHCGCCRDMAQQVIGQALDAAATHGITICEVRRLALAA